MTESTEIVPVDCTAGNVLVAGIVCNGMVISRVVEEPEGTVCNAERLTSMLTAAVPLVAVTTP